jgi:hypothetical protein
MVIIRMAMIVSALMTVVAVTSPEIGRQGMIQDGPATTPADIVMMQKISAMMQEGLERVSIDIGSAALVVTVHARQQSATMNGLVLFA